MPDYGERVQGGLKGEGFLGRIPMQNGTDGVMTEQTIGVDIGEGEWNIPLIVPTLTKEELDGLAKGEKPTKIMVGKAIAHALSRKKLGLSPYYDNPSETPTKEQVLTRQFPRDTNLLDLLASFNSLNNLKR